MKKTISFALCTAMLAGCSLTAPQQAAVTSAGVTLATVAAQNSTSVADLVKRGALFCKQTALLAPATVVLANAAGVPVSVTGMASDDVMRACQLINAVPVSPPADPAAVTIVSAPAALPAV